MPSLIFATGNNEKFSIAQAACRPHGIELIQQSAGTEEIQSEDLEYIIRHKAETIFAKLGRPVIVSDDSWQVPALNGFPGPYMKSIDHWFTPQDWLDLMARHDDRRIILVQQLAYCDNNGCTVFRNEYTGHILPDARGNYGRTLQKVVTMPSDNGLSISEVYDRGVKHEGRDVIEGWRDFIDWYNEQHAG